MLQPRRSLRRAYRPARLVSKALGKRRISSKKYHGVRPSPESAFSDGTSHKPPYTGLSKPPANAGERVGGYYSPGYNLSLRLGPE